jgi:hypothetical protein
MAAPGYRSGMTWILIALGIAVVAFIGLGLVLAAFQDRDRGQEVVDDLDERLSQTPDDPNGPIGH